MVPLLVMVP